MQEVRNDQDQKGQTGQRGQADEKERGPMPTIALVDDDRNILTSVSIALESEGYHVQP